MKDLVEEDIGGAMVEAQRISEGRECSNDWDLIVE